MRHKVYACYASSPGDLVNSASTTNRGAWSDDLIIGNDQIDQDHRQFFEIIWLLRSAIDQGERCEIIESLLSDLVDSMVTHFGREERLMDRFDPHIKHKHTEEHSAFIHSLGEIFLLYEKGGFVMFQAMLEKLEQGFKMHIVIFDRDLPSR